MINFIVLIDVKNRIKTKYNMTYLSVQFRGVQDILLISNLTVVKDLKINNH